MDAIVDPVSLYEPVYSDGGDAICVMDQVSDNRNNDENWTDLIRSEGGAEKAGRPGAAHHSPALLRGQDPDGGQRRGWGISRPR